MDDLAAACLFLMHRYDDSAIINVGVGEDISISDLASLIREVVGFSGDIVYDRSKPDGIPRKLLEVSKLQSLGWIPQISLAEGIRDTYDWFINHHQAARGIK